MIELSGEFDAARRALGYLTSREILEKFGRGNRFIDIQSVLISENVMIGDNNVFYPHTILDTMHGGSIVVGDHNIFYPMTTVAARYGRVQMGNRNELGKDGGVSIHVSSTVEDVLIGHFCRLWGGATITGSSMIGNCSQIFSSRKARV